MTTEISFPGPDDAELLEGIVAHYGAALADSAATQRWLVERGVVHGEVVEVFGLGLSDRTLGLSLPTNATVAGRELRSGLQ